MKHLFWFLFFLNVGCALANFGFACYLGAGQNLVIAVFNTLMAVLMYFSAREEE